MKVYEITYKRQCSSNDGVFVEDQPAIDKQDAIRRFNESCKLQKTIHPAAVYEIRSVELKYL